MRSALERLERVADRPGGPEVIAHEWNRFKRVIKVRRTDTSYKCSFKAFRSLFYRLREDAVGDLGDLGERWANSSGNAQKTLTQLQKLRHDFLKAVLKPGVIIHLSSEAAAVANNLRFKCSLCCSGDLGESFL